MQVSSEVESERHQLEREDGWNPPRLSMADAIEQSSRMAERAHTHFLRTVKMLHELRWLSPTLYVGVQLPQSWRHVETLLNEQTPDHILDRALPLGDEWPHSHLDRMGRTEECRSRWRNEVGLRRGSHERLATSTCRSR